MDKFKSPSSFSHLFPYSIHVLDNQKCLVDNFIDVLEDRLKKRLIVKTPRPLGLATGRTMEPIYKTLVARLQQWPTSELDVLCKDWCSFNLDEYIGLSCGDARSYVSYMARYLGNPLRLSKRQLHIPNGMAPDLDKEASRYSDHIRRLGGIGVQILGLGANGHVGFNEPPCEPDASCRIVHLSESTRKQNAYAFGGNVKSVPPLAITLGLREILLAEEIHLIVCGSDKVEILKSLMNSRCSKHLPASWLRMHGRVSLWLDKPAVEGNESFALRFLK